MLQPVRVAALTLGVGCAGQLSFVGRPFDLREAETHLKRLRAAGFTFLRLIVTWEAIEPSEPGVYCEEYIAFIVGVVRAAGALGLSVLVDPHQDVWSRYTGGSGAPKWTLEKLGLRAGELGECGAAVVHAATRTRAKPPTMSWITNHMYFAAATMNTLFFAGDRSPFPPHRSLSPTHAHTPLSPTRTRTACSRASLSTFRALHTHAQATQKLARGEEERGLRRGLRVVCVVFVV